MPNARDTIAGLRPQPRISIGRAGLRLRALASGDID